MLKIARGIKKRARRQNQIEKENEKEMDLESFHELHRHNLIEIVLARRKANDKEDECMNAQQSFDRNHSSIDKIRHR